MFLRGFDGLEVLLLDDLLCNFAKSCEDGETHSCGVGKEIARASLTLITHVTAMMTFFLICYFHRCALELARGSGLLQKPSEAPSERWYAPPALRHARIRIRIITYAS